MKNCYHIEKNISKKYYKILDFDKNEINNPEKYHPIRLNYLDRIKTVISIVKRTYPSLPRSEIKIGDFACAQGNLSLLLAELGYNPHSAYLGRAKKDLSSRLSL